MRPAQILNSKRFFLILLILKDSSKFWVSINSNSY